MTVIPSGYDLKQLDPAQPVTMYDTFVNALVQEAARPLLAPRNLALGNSGGYNMASGALDRQFYRQAINQERLSCNEEELEQCLEYWWYEAIRIPGYFDDEYVRGNQNPISSIVTRFQSLREESPRHVFRWDEVPEHTDPVKVAQAIDILYKGHHLSDTDIQEARYNRSVEEHYANLEKQYQWHAENLSPETEQQNKQTEQKLNQKKSPKIP
mgnify:FL=1